VLEGACPESPERFAFRGGPGCPGAEYSGIKKVMGESNHDLCTLTLSSRMGPDVTGKEVVLLDKNGTRHVAPPPLLQHFRVAGHSLPSPPMYEYKPFTGPSNGERIHQQRLDHTLARLRPAAGNFPDRKDACGARGSSYVYDPSQKWSESFPTSSTPSNISMVYCVFHRQDRHTPFPCWRAGGEAEKKFVAF